MIKSAKRVLCSSREMNQLRLEMRLTYACRPMFVEISYKMTTPYSWVPSVKLKWKSRKNNYKMIKAKPRPFYQGSWNMNFQLPICIWVKLDKMKSKILIWPVSKDNLFLKCRRKGDLQGPMINIIWQNHVYQIRFWVT